MSVLKILISKNYFTEQDYNRAIKRHKFSGHESSDRPELIDVTKPKLKGKALSINCHLRNIGFFLNYCDPKPEMFSEECILLIQKLHAIVEIIMAPSLRTYEIDYFEEEIVSYLNLRQKLRTEFECVSRPKPKTHYLSHYPEATRLYGPMINVWTARYEAKHRIAKMLCNSAKNFLNISKTLAVRQQFRQASMMYSGLYETEEVVLPSKGVKMKEDLVDCDNASIFGQIKYFMDETSTLSDEIKFRGQCYKIEDIVVLKAIHRNHLKVGVIKAIIFKKDDVFFLVSKYEAFRHELRFFEASATEEELGSCSFVLAENLADYKPCIKHGSSKRFRFVIHHHISVDCCANNFDIDPTL